MKYILMLSKILNLVRPSNYLSCH